MGAAQESTFGPLPLFDNVTPADLAGIVSAYRAWALKCRAEATMPHHASDFATISEKGIEDLVRCCYLASLQPEEGSYPRFLVVVGGGRSPELVTRFTPSIPLDNPNVLRKLAPALAAEFAVSVREHASGLHCEGIALNQWEKNFILNPPRTLPINNGMCIRVQAPGEITIAEEHLTYHTRGGRAWPELSIGFAPGVYKWLCELTSWVGSRLKKPEACGFFGAQQSGMVSDWLVDTLWSRVLHTAQHLGHGGAFVIRPDGVSAGISIKRTTTSPHLGEELVQHLNAVAEDRGALAAGRLSLLTHALSLAHLSTVDGCVVLDRSLRLRGFAGHIQIDDGQLQNQSLTFADCACEPRSEEELRTLGSRHNSAFRLCKAYPNHLAFVISQDGDVRLFTSDEEHVFETRLSPNSGSLLSW